MADNRRLPADLHSTMYLLNLCPHILLTFQQAHLHSTMYLLNPLHTVNRYPRI